MSTYLPVRVIGLKASCATKPSPKKLHNMEISAEDRVMDTAGEIARLSYTLVWVGRFQDKKNAGRSGREPEVEEVSTEEGRPLCIPIGKYTLAFTLWKPSKSSVGKRKDIGAALLKTSLLVARSNTAARVELFDDKDKVVATMSIRMVLDPGDALFQSAPSREPLQDGEPEISALSLLDETMTCLDKRMRHRCDPNIFAAAWLVLNTLWSYWSVELPSKLKLKQDPTAQHDTRLEALKLVTSPEDNPLYDLVEQMHAQVLFVDDYFTRASPANPDYATLENLCRDLLQELYASAILLHGRADLFCGTTYDGLVNLATDSVTAQTVVDFDVRLYRLARLRTKMETAMHPLLPRPTDSYVEFIPSFLPMALAEYAAGVARRYWSMAKTFRGNILEDLYKRLVDSISTIADVSERAENRDLMRRFLTGLVQDTDRFPRFLVHSNVRKEQSSIVDAGGYSRIFLGKLTQGDAKPKTVAMKNIDVYPKTKHTDTDLKQMYLEILTSMTLRHPNVIQVFGLHRDLTSSYILTPWQAQGNLRYHLNMLRNTPERYSHWDVCASANQWIEDVARGMAYLHEEYLAHGDLRAHNVLLSDDGNAIITDFGVTVFINAQSDDYRSRRSGHVRWTAPEILRMKEDGNMASARPAPHADIWSFAQLCIEIYTDENPYENLADDKLVREQLLTNAPWPCTQAPPFKVKDKKAYIQMPTTLWDLLQSCWNIDPTKRSSSAEVLEAVRGVTPKRRILA